MHFSLPDGLQVFLAEHFRKEDRVAIRVAHHGYPDVLVIRDLALDCHSPVREARNRILHCTRDVKLDVDRTRSTCRPGFGGRAMCRPRMRLDPAWISAHSSPIWLRSVKPSAPW